MRRSLLLAGFFGSLSLGGCSDRRLDVDEDYSEVVEQLCENLCEKVVTCKEPPAFETQEECQAVCTNPSTEVYEDSACGDGFRAYYKCLGDTATCEEFFETQDVLADDYRCKAETDVIVALKCGAREETD